MGKVRITDNLPRFVRLNEGAMDRALSRMAKDTLTMSKIRVPFKSSELQKDSDYKKKTYLHYQVWYYANYAAYQERGERKDGSRKVRNYTTPGTGSKFLGDAGDSIKKKALSYWRQAVSSIKL